MAEINRRTEPTGHLRARAEQRGPGAVPRDPATSSTRKPTRGGELRPQTTARGIGLLFGLQHRTFFDRAPAWAALAAALARRAPRARSTTPSAGPSSLQAAEANTPPLDWQRRVRAHRRRRRLLRRSRQRRSPRTPNARARRSPEAFVRISLETRGRALFNYPFLNQRMDAVEEMLDHPRMAIGLGDSGAHVGLIMDASLPTWFLLHWVRDRQQVHDRGRDPAHDLRHRRAVRHRRPRRAPTRRVRRRQRDRPRRLGARAPRVRARLPHRRRALRATRRAATPTTIVNGEVFVEDGTPTGTHAGRTLRS